MLRWLPFLLALMLVAPTGCGGEDEASGGGSITVVATTTQVGGMTRAVAGERARVVQLLSASSDPHDYEPRPSDARRLARSALVLRSGGDLDEWSAGLVDTAGGKPRLINLIDSVRTIENGEVDPHWWQDPANGVSAVEAIRDALIDADPAGRGAYERNARRYVGELRRLDRSIASCLSRVPREKRKLVTTHDALGYFARRYDIEVIGALIPSLSTQAQPSARDTERLVGQIRRERVEAIFPESSLDPRLERAVARESGARVGGALWADALGPAGSAGATYVGSMADNTRKLVDGFSGGRVSCRSAP